MPDWSLVDRSHVLAAIAEHDRLGDREFLRRYGFGRAKAHSLWHGGQEYEPLAIVGVASLRATGTPATSADFADGEQGAVGILAGLGFDIAVDEEALAAQPARKAPAAPKKRAAKVEAAPKLCPRCYVALPATGVCDFCD